LPIFFSANENNFFKELISDKPNIDKLKEYIDNGLNINFTDIKKRTVLFALVYRHRIDSIKIVIDLGIDIYRENNYGKTILDEVLNHYDFIMIQCLVLELGFDINKKNSKGKTALENNLFFNNKQIAGMFLNFDSQFDLYNQKDRKLYIDGMIKKNVELFKGFLRYIKDINIKDEQGRNLVFNEVMKDYYYQGRYEDFQMLDILIEKGIDINCIDNSGKTPLMYMVEYGVRIKDKQRRGYFIKRLKNFLKYKVNLNIQDKDGQTVIHKVVIADDLEVLENLLEKKVDVNLKDKQGRTALHHTQWKGNYQIARWLIASGADMDLPDNSGFTILNYATISRHVRLIITLILSGALMYNENPKNKKVAYFFKSKEKSLDMLLFANISDNKMQSNLIRVVINLKKEINKTLGLKGKR